VSLLVEIARRADAPVEGVVRVLTKRPVSEGVRDRVLAALDDLSPDQLAVVERFALATVPDVVPQGGSLHYDTGDEDVVRALELDATLRREAGAVASRVHSSVVAGNGSDDELLLELTEFLRELVRQLAELQRRAGALREDRVADLAVLTELVSTGWERIDRRLGRMEKVLARLEGPQQ
jgi:hypothetical protein